MLYVYSSFSNTNREEMKALPGSVTLYDREPVLQNWSIARSAVTGSHALGCVPLAPPPPAVADEA